MIAPGTRLFFSIAILFLSTSVGAEMVEVTVSTEINAADFTIGTDSVFGVAPSTLTFSVTLQIDTSTGVDMASAGPTLVHDIWGYNTVSATATFGNKTWTNFLVLSLNDDIDASRVFVGTELAPGATVERLAFRMQDSDGFLIVGTLSCTVGGVCQAFSNTQSGMHIRDFNGGPLGATNDVVITDTFTIVVAGGTDADSDGVPDGSDNCTDVANSDQRDTNGDGIGNICDPDVNDDCIVNFLDLQTYSFNFFATGDLDTDNNGDGSTNFLDFQITVPFVFGPPGPSATGCN